MTRELPPPGELIPPGHNRYQWTLRCPPFNTLLVMELRKLAYRRRISEGVLLNAALERYLEAELKGDQ